MPTHVPAREIRPGATDDWQIPAVIHQTFKTGEVTEAMHTAAQSWIDLNPEYEYRFHDDMAVQQLIESCFDTKTADAYARIKAGAFKADFWRYCLLYLHGGIYADIDTVCLSPMSELLSPCDEFVSAAAGPPRDFAIYNCFICARPRHPFLAAAIERATEMLRDTRRHHGYMVTGPGNLGQAANGVLGREACAAHVPGTTTFSGTTYRLLEKRKATATTRRQLTWEGNPILFTEYENYKEDLEILGSRHWRDTSAYNNVLSRATCRIRRVISSFRK